MRWSRACIRCCSTPHNPPSLPSSPSSPCVCSLGRKQKRDKIFGGAKLEMIKPKDASVTFKDIAGIDQVGGRGGAPGCACERAHAGVCVRGRPRLLAGIDQVGWGLCRLRVGACVCQGCAAALDLHAPPLPATACVLLLQATCVLRVKAEFWRCCIPQPACRSPCLPVAHLDRLRHLPGRSRPKSWRLLPSCATPPSSCRLARAPPPACCWSVPPVSLQRA